MIAPGVIPTRTATAKLSGGEQPCPQSGVAAVQVDYAGGVADHLRGRTLWLSRPRGRRDSPAPRRTHRRRRCRGRPESRRWLPRPEGARRRGLDSQPTAAWPGRCSAYRARPARTVTERCRCSWSAGSGRAPCGPCSRRRQRQCGRPRTACRPRTRRWRPARRRRRSGRCRRSDGTTAHEVEPDRPSEREVVLRDGGRLPRAPAQLGVQVSDPLRLGGPGELGDQVQRRRHAGGDRGRGGHRPVLDPAAAPHPVHRRPALLQAPIRDQWLVASSPSSIPVSSEDERPAAHAKDLRAVLVLGGHPVPQRGFGAAGRLAEGGHDDQVGLRAGSASTSANVYVGTTAGPPSRGAGSAPAATT